MGCPLYVHEQSVTFLCTSTLHSHYFQETVSNALTTVPTCLRKVVIRLRRSDPRVSEESLQSLLVTIPLPTEVSALVEASYS